jgi:hypothetical protein
MRITGQPLREHPDTLAPVEGMTSRVWWLLPALSVLLGALLGLENLSAPEASGWLRVPALLAALILVAQGLLDFENGRRARAMNLPAPEGSLPALNPAAPPVVLNPDDVVVHESRQPARQQAGAVALEQAIQAQQLAARLVAGTAVRESRGAVVAVLVLAIWLGLATLNYSNSPTSLLRLSLLASFLLFASAWSMLQKRAS